MILLTPAQVKKLVKLANHADYLVIEHGLESGTILVTKWFGTDSYRVTLNQEGK